MNKRVMEFETAYAKAMKANPGGAGLALVNCVKSLKKIVRKAEVASLTDEWSNERIVQTRGPVLEFTGKLLASYSTGDDTRKERWQEAEIWETRAGAYVAVLMGNSDVEGERDFVTAAVIEPGGDEQERQIAVMDVLTWTDRARDMVAGLGWSLSINVD